MSMAVYIVNGRALALASQLGRCFVSLLYYTSAL